VYGSVVSGRPDDLQGIEQRIGLFINTLPLRSSFNDEMEIVEWMQNIQKDQVASRNHQYTPLHDIQGWTDIKGDMFDNILVFDNYPISTAIKENQWSLKVENVTIHEKANYPLNIVVSSAEQINFDFIYNEDLLKKEYVTEIFKHFENILKQVISNNITRLADLKVLTEAEEVILVDRFNDTATRNMTDQSVMDFFTGVAARTPQAISVVFDEEQLTYEELDHRSNKLANYLISKGVTKESLVPICLNPSVETIMSILAILKAGAAYVPIDPEYPGDRITFILNDTQASLAISNGDNIVKLQKPYLDIIELDADFTKIDKQSPENPALIIDSSQLAYVIYTSGSTGLPKGVMIEHRNLLNYLLNDKTKYIDENKSGSGSFIHLSYTFDASITALFMPLLSGKSIVIGSKHSVDVFDDANFEKYAPYDFLKITPSYLELLQLKIRTSSGGLVTEKLVIGGEALLKSQLNAFVEEGLNLEIINEYGPTEATVGCSTYCFHTLENYNTVVNNRISIGKPIDNTQLYILNEKNQLVPVGIPGEICISGMGVARGYLNQPELTGKKFIKNPFSKDDNARLYKTGDIGRWTPEGNIDYLGRVDDQVKIHGYRIELGEIESYLSTLAGVKNARVLVNENKSLTDKKLNAYIQVDKDKFPLLSNYQHLLNKKQIQASDLNVMPNGLPILNSNLNEVRFLYQEIFEDHCYLKHGITLNEDSCVIDIGANAGFFNVFLNVLSKDIKIYAFEPIPEVYHFLVANRELYNVKGKAFQLAILDKETEIDFNYFPHVTIVSGISDDRIKVKDVVRSYIQNSEQGELLPEEMESLLEAKLESKRIRCKTKTISQIIEEENITRIDLLKVDVENSEHLVINGLLEKDWDKIQSIIIEVHDLEGRLNNIKDLLEQKGFHTYIEKEQMLSKDDILYNLFALRKNSSNRLSAMGDKEKQRSVEWTHPLEFCKILKDRSEGQLPKYMVPSHFVLLDQFPLTSNGKIDKKALPDPELIEVKESDYTAPVEETEKTLVSIWKDLLELDNISIHDDFFDIGGHSLLAVRLISSIRKELGVEMRINDIFDFPTIALLSKQLDSQKKSSDISTIRVQPRPGKIPLSFSQERLWFIDKLEGSVHYHVPSVLRFTGALNTEALSNAINEIVNRHEVLRSVIIEEDGIGFQVVNEKNHWRLSIEDGSHFNNHFEDLQQHIYQLIRKPFDLSSDYMFRANLIKINETEHVLVVTMHHIASDAWSMSIIVKEVIELYAAYMENRVPSLPIIEIQYADYAIWQRNYLQGKVLDDKLRYWKEKLKGITPLKLPVDFNRPVFSKTTGAIIEFKIDNNLSHKLQELGKQQGASLFMTLIAAFKILLKHYTGQQDICVGTSIASRQHKDLEGLIGFFVNTLALRTEVRDDASFISLLQQVKETTLGAYAHQEVPFEKVVDAVVIERDMGRSPLFQVMLVLNNTPQVPQLLFGDVKLSYNTFEHYISKFDFTFFIKETNEGLQVKVEYRPDLFKAETITRLTDSFLEIISSVVKEPEHRIGTLQVLSKAEADKLLIDFNHSRVWYPKDRTIVDLFEEQSARTPEEVAVVFGEESLTYRQLNERSNQLAHYLRGRGVQEETLVPLCVERSHEMLVGMLGILKAGGAYVPLEADFPEERKNFVLQDTGARVVVSSMESSSKLPLDTDVEIIEVDGEWSAIKAQPVDNVQSRVGAGHLAYVIYTSGSTGKPKGVMIEHRNLVDYVYGLQEHIQIGQCKSYAVVSSIATDLGNTGIYSSLVFGGTLHVFSKQSVSNIELLHRYFAEHTIDCLKIVPSHWKALSMGRRLLLPSRLLVFGGEALSPEVIDTIRLSGSVCRVVNHYGPTETTIGKLLHSIDFNTSYNKSIPIGKPFSNTQVYVLSKEKQLCPIGVWGELHIGGDGVARGYLNNRELTEQKFIKDPFEKGGSKGRIYRTGDLVRWDSEGNIEFMGRVDDQVKIRGYRIELGEIESVVLQSEQVNQAVVVAKEDTEGIKRLVGYVIPEQVFEKEWLLSYLREKLPDYMVPTQWVELESFPLLPNGKVDRKALPDPEISNQSNGLYVAPRNEMELKLAEIWQNILEVSQVGVNDDFFELGGHSLLAVRLISAVRKEFVVEIPISDVFDYPTIALLGKQIQNASGRSILPEIMVKPRMERIPLSFSQERLWFIDKLEGSVQYHVNIVLQLNGNLRKDALEYSLRTIVNRHEVLRTVILEQDGEPYQFIKEKNKWNLLEIDGSLYKNDRGLLQEDIKKYFKRPFDLSEDDMIRAALFTIDTEEYVLVVTIHHLASDGWSKSILVKEVVALYRSYIEGSEPLLPHLEIQYADYAIWQREYLDGEVLNKKIEYWKKKLQNTTPLQLPTDYPRPAIQRTRGAKMDFHLNKDLTEALQQLSQQNGCTLFMTLIASLKLLLHRYSGQKDICIGTPIANRMQQEIEQLIGFFVNTLAIRSEIDPNASFKDLLQLVKQTTMEAYHHQEAPFEKVVEATVKGRDMGRNPLFQVMFVLRNTPEIPELQLGDLLLTGIGHEHTTALFDMTFLITETSSGLEGTLEYSTDLFSSNTISRMINHFKQIMYSVIKAPEQSIGRLQMLSEEEQQQLLFGFNDTKVNFPLDLSIVNLLEGQVEKTPDAIALVFERETFSYKELNEKVNQLANHLLEQHCLKADEMVAVLLNRSSWSAIAMLAIIKTGACYVPVDPELPEARLKYIIHDASPKVIITDDTIATRYPALLITDAISVSSFNFEGFSSVNPVVDIHPDDLSYIIYTSGSTGMPKGVMQTHRMLYNLIQWDNHLSGLPWGVRILQYSSFAFDFSIQDLCFSLTNGGTCYVLNESIRLDFPALAQYICEQQIEIVSIPFSALNNFFNVIDISLLNGHNIQHIISTGEQLVIGTKLENFLNDHPHIRIHNFYGPSETHVVTASSFSTMQKLPKHIPIGKPISNSCIYILDKYHNPAPLCVPGEIYIGGHNLARGYLKNETLTKEKFVSHFFNGNEILYKTGDVGRWLQDGNIEYLGRFDDQVKIRGYRIELGEIESLLHQCELIKQAVVLAKDDKEGNKRLIGYIVPEKLFDRKEIVAYLKRLLPDYMIPALWVELQYLPLTPNGKVNKNALPDPDASELLDNEYVAPRNEIEEALVDMWQNLLGVKRVGIYDNFFELGGHSLMVIKMVANIKKKFLLAIPISALFQFTCINDLSKYLEWQIYSVNQDNSNSDNGKTSEEDKSSFEVLNI
jgi:amino acid adenylation domain-containing protein/FkbM family methyltransferase